MITPCKIIVLTLAICRCMYFVHVFLKEFLQAGILELIDTLFSLLSSLGTYKWAAMLIIVC